MATDYSLTKVTTGKVRLSYAHLNEPEVINGQGEPKYSTAILIPKTDTKTLNKIKAAQKAAAEAGKSTKFGGKIPHNLKTTLHDGDEEQDTEEHPEYAGMMYMNVSSKSQPALISNTRGADGKWRELDNPEEEIYSGVYARVSMNFFAYSNSGNKGVSAGLNNVQKVADGDRLGGGRSNPEDDFDDEYLEDDEDTDFLD